VHSPQSFNQLSLRQQLMLQAQQNLISPSVGDIESRRLGMLFNDRNMGLVKDGQSNSVEDLVPSNGSTAQVGSPMLPHPDSDVFFKVSHGHLIHFVCIHQIICYILNCLLQQQILNSNQQLQQYSQHPLPSQPSDNLQQQEKLGPAPGSMTIEGNVSNSLQGNDQVFICCLCTVFIGFSAYVGILISLFVFKAPKTKAARKRKSTSSSGPGISSGTTNTTGPPASSPSTTSTQTPGEMITVSTLQQNAPSSKSSFMFGTDGLGSLTTSQNQLVRDSFVHIF